MSVPGVDGDVTCRANRQDANHLWYFHAGKPLTPAGGEDQACDAATKILAPGTETPAQ